MKFILLYIILFIFGFKAFSQCFATAGNPVGGTENIGTLDKNLLRTQISYRNNYSSKYFYYDDRYFGNKRILNEALYNYMDLMAAYGITEKITFEAQAGYFINKTQRYNISDYQLRGNGLSNINLNFKPRLYFNTEKRIEITVMLGLNLPLRREYQIVNNVVLPIDLQSSSLSNGLIFQGFFVKENSFKAWRIFYIPRFEMYFENKYNFKFGNSFHNSFYYSRHFIFKKIKIKDWTTILQLKNIIKNRNYKYGERVNASGNNLLFIVPQINASISDTWNISGLIEIPIYQYYNEIQLGTNYSCNFMIIKDLDFKK